MKWIYLTANILNSIRDITSATLSILRGVTVPLDVLQIKVRCFFSLRYILFLSEMLNKPEERITGLLSSCMTFISFALHACVSRGRKNNQCLLWWDCVGVHLEMQLQQSASKIIWIEFWFILGNLQIEHEIILYPYLSIGIGTLDLWRSMQPTGLVLYG